ncbi:lipopolysaccharide export system protein LptC [Tamilnaduibacter salinus]|uniref:Lipopolysaccharide export system protein LptC n=1 Tax=Tamilnaduibacter salinus TaxID=1484056 RepID=A0A2U1CUJ9_9GAMM|nr:LPS export ABC transporter periplasmic protein LptC [Tamilnaduibacter salinus]PVY70762.1 lipopolysaccharide export system protein LptC [Tamilnaduibacter salinus]
MSLRQQIPRLRHLLIVVIAMALVALLWQSDEQSHPDSAADLRGPDEPDSFVVNGVFRSYSEDGALKSELHSERIEQFDNRKVAHLMSPRAVIRNTGTEQPWVLEAAEGRYERNQEQLHLSGNVAITRPLDDGAQARLSSDRLTLDNRRRIVHTDAPVVLDSPRGVTHAVGLKGWIDDRVLELQSQVEGRYDLRSSSP